MLEDPWQKPPGRVNPRKRRLTGDRRRHPRSFGGRRGLWAAARDVGTHGTSRGFRAGGLGPLRSPGRAGGSRGALSSPASLASPRQLLNDSHSFMSDIRDAEEGAGGLEGPRTMSGANIPGSVLVVKDGRVCAGKTFRSSPSWAASHRDPGVILQEIHGVGRGGDAGAPPWVGSESCPGLAAGHGVGWGRAGRTPRVDGPPLPRAAFGPRFCSKHNQIKETALEITCLDWLRLHAGHTNRGRAPSRGTLSSLSLAMLRPCIIPNRTQPVPGRHSQLPSAGGPGTVTPWEPKSGLA